MKKGCKSYCRGDPPWPPVAWNRIRQSPRPSILESVYNPRAATEGRPFSTFHTSEENSMRKVTFGGASSLDNFFARKDDSVDWLLWCKEVQQIMKDYWKNKTGGDTAVSNTDEKSLVPKLKLSGLKGPFGSDYVEIRPTGVVSLDFGARWQRVYNPNIPIRQQRQGQFDFDQTISMNVVGKIGEKLKLTTNWDTKAAFEFQNNMKLEFTGFEEDIIQKIEAGNVSLPVNSAL